MVSLIVSLYGQILFYWCSETLQNIDGKAIFKVNSNRKGNAMAIDSLNISEDEERENGEVEGLKHEIKSPKLDLFVYINDTLLMNFILDENSLAKRRGMEAFDLSRYAYDCTR